MKRMVRSDNEEGIPSVAFLYKRQLQKHPLNKLIQRSRIFSQKPNLILEEVQESKAHSEFPALASQVSCKSSGQAGCGFLFRHPSACSELK